MQKKVLPKKVLFEDLDEILGILDDFRKQCWSQITKSDIFIEEPSKVNLPGKYKFPVIKVFLTDFH